MWRSYDAGEEKDTRKGNQKHSLFSDFLCIFLIRNVFISQFPLPNSQTTLPRGYLRKFVLVVLFLLPSYSSHHIIFYFPAVSCI